MKEFNNKNPFKTPEGYFEELPDRILDRLSEDGNSLPKNDGFVLPDGYFDGLHKTIRQKLEAEAPKVIPLYPYKKYYYAVASVAAVALAIFLLNRNTSQQITFEDIANSDIENYFGDNESDFSPYEMAEVLPIDELEISDILTDGLDDTLILEYVDNNTNNYEDLNLDDEQPD